VTLFALADRFPARTGRGSAMLERVRGLRYYIATTEAEQIRFQEREQIFSRYLPYAMVFGLTERWARRFAGLAVSGPDGELYWYSGTIYGYSNFGETIGDFTSVAIGSVGTSPVSTAGASGFSGGGGYSDGGGGGGGGGSW
jgi:hypothetical protein